MKVIVGDQIYDAAEGRPIAVYLSDTDKKNIADMADDVRVYSLYIMGGGGFPKNRALQIDWCAATRKACEE